MRINLMMAAMVLLLAGVTPATAWGARGHQLIAEVAELKLNQDARRKVEDLLRIEGSSSLPDVASWADRVRGSSDNLPRHSARLREVGDQPINCGRKNPCATDAIERYLDVLGDERAAEEERLRALKFVVHLVGDIHQPLHNTADPGGAKAIYRGRLYSLHKLWDTVLIRRYSRSGLTDEVMRQADVSTPGAGTPLDWAREGRDIATRSIFPRTGAEPTRVDDQYLREARPIIVRRLALGGLRLARVLNDTLGKPAAAGPVEGD